jgi:hypothetical protein
LALLTPGKMANYCLKTKLGGRRGTTGDGFFVLYPYMRGGKVIKETPSPAVPADPRHFALVFVATSVVSWIEKGGEC